MNTASWVKGSKKEENIAVKLSGRIKNFTGRTPAIIKVRINAPMVTIHFKWVVRDSEKSLISQNPDTLNKMHKRLCDFTKESLDRILPGVFGSKIEFYRLDSDEFQENLIVQVQLLNKES